MIARKNIALLMLWTLTLSSGFSFAQGWVPDNGDFGKYQYSASHTPPSIEFRTDGPLGRNWIHGSYLDKDTNYRVIAYREGGNWVPLPFYAKGAGTCSDIEMYGDTLYMLGFFYPMYDDSSGQQITSYTGLLKWFNDSLWADEPIKILGGQYGKMETRGDSIILWAGLYQDTTFSIPELFMSTDGAVSWQYPFSIIHPTDNTPDFGAIAKLEILENGDILMLNGGSPLHSPFNGIVRWDGHQWHSYGQGIQSIHRAGDFEFYKGDLYMCGGFDSRFEPNDPGTHLARWDGSNWGNVGGGLIGSASSDVFVHNDVLYCVLYSYDHDSTLRYGDAPIPYLAGWDGYQWCGTPIFLDQPPNYFGYINDTLWASFYQYPGIVNGDSSVFMMYFDGDYLHGANAICSTPGLSAKEQEIYQVGVYPNPTDNELRIEVGHKVDGVAGLYDMGGTLLFREVFNGSGVILQLPEFSSGVYLLKLKFDGKVFTEKVVIKSD